MNKDLILVYLFSGFCLTASLLLLPLVQVPTIADTFLSGYSTLINLIDYSFKTVDLMDNINGTLSHIGTNISGESIGRLYTIIISGVILLFSTLFSLVLSFLTNNRSRRNLIKYATFVTSIAFVIILITLRLNLNVGAYIDIIALASMVYIVFRFNSEEDETQQERAERLAALRQNYENSICGVYEEVRKMPRHKVERILANQIAGENDSAKVETLKSVLTEIDIRKACEIAFSKVINLPKNEIDGATQTDKYGKAAQHFIIECNQAKIFPSMKIFVDNYRRTLLSDQQIALENKTAKQAKLQRMEQISLGLCNINREEKRNRIILAVASIVVILFYAIAV